MGNRLRLRFSKTGRAKYISHLDLMATMRRALLRAGIKLEYSGGFNPHPYMSIALPLPVGCSGMCELVDIGTEHDLLPDGLAEIINPAMPEGIEILEVYPPMRKFSGIAWVEISGTLYYDNPPEQIVQKLTRRFSEENIVVSKKTKSGISLINIAQFIKDVCYNDETPVTMSAKLSARDPSISHINLMSALDGKYAQLAPDYSAFTRVEVYDADMRPFR